MKSPAKFLLILCLFAAFGFMFGVWQVALADLKQALDLSPGALGMALTAGILASLPAMLFGGRIADRWGVRPVIAVTAVLMGLAFLGFSLVSGYAALIVLLMVFLGMSGVFDVGINAAAISYEQSMRKKALTWFHAAFSGGAALSALLCGLLLAAGAPFRMLYLIVALLLGALAVLVWRSSGLERGGHIAGAGKPTALYRHPAILLLGLITALGMFSEGTLESWSAIYLRSSLDFPAMVGASGVAVFHAAMTLGRLLASPVVARVERRRVLQFAGGLAAGGMLLALASLSAPLILSGLLLVGLGLAVVVPVGFSLAGDMAPERAGEATSVIAVLGYSGFMIGPVLVGGLAEWLGLRLALAAVIVCGGLIVALSFSVGTVKSSTLVTATQTSPGD